MAVSDGRDVLAAALEYRSNGYVPIPVVVREKRPALPNWLRYDPTDDRLQTDLGNGPTNIGLLLGERSGGEMELGSRSV